MARRTPRIISRAVTAAIAKKKRGGIKHPSSDPRLAPYVPKPKTEVDKLFDLIYDRCVYGYRFTDDYYGIPWIEKSDIEDKGDGLFVIRFRCPTEKTHHVFFGVMAEDVCNALNCSLHFIHETRWECYSEDNKLPYEECVWVIQKDELTRSEKGEFKEEEDDDFEHEADHFYDQLEEPTEDDLKDESTAEEIEERFRLAEESFV